MVGAEDAEDIQIAMSEARNVDAGEQICLSGIELLGLLEPSAKAYACLFRLQRAIDRILAAAGVAPDLNELDVPGDSELR
jgi:hypothetical protein